MSDLALRCLSALRYGPANVITLSKFCACDKSELTALLRRDHRFLMPFQPEGLWELSEHGRMFLEMNDIELPKPAAESVIGDGWKKDLKEKIAEFTNKINLAYQFWEKRPFFYDEYKLLWLWDNERKCWIISVETEILNAIREVCDSVSTTAPNTKNEILEAIRQVGFEKKPKPIKPTWIQFRNKIIDIETNEEIAPSPLYFCSNPIPWDIGNDEDTPTIDRILNEWVGSEWERTLKELIAYCLLPDYPIHRIFYLTGSGSNGKSKFLEMVIKFLGKENCCASSLDAITSNRFESARLYKKLLCTMGETNFKTLSKTEYLKKLTGGDLIAMEFKHKSPFDTFNYAKIAIATNSMPESTDTTDGFMRRMLRVDFPNKFSEKMDVLKQIPDQEYANLCKKSVRILREVLATREFTNEGTIEERRTRYVEASNPLVTFIKENCVVCINGYIPFFIFKEAFYSWQRENGHRVWNDNELGAKLKRQGLETKQKKYSKRGDGEERNWRTIFGLVFKDESFVPDSEDGKTYLASIKKVTDVAEVTDVSISSYVCEKYMDTTATSVTSVTPTSVSDGNSQNLPSQDTKIVTQEDTKIPTVSTIDNCINMWRSFGGGEADESWLRSFLKMTDWIIEEALRLGVVFEVSPGRFRLV